MKATRQQSHPYPKKEISEYWPHDVAFGIQLSIDSGKNGVVTFEAKTSELARHYIQDFGAIRIFPKYSGGPIMLMIADHAAISIFNTYLS